MSEDITKVIAHPRKHKDTAFAGVICLEENITDFKEKLDLIDGKHAILDH